MILVKKANINRVVDGPTGKRKDNYYLNANGQYYIAQLLKDLSA